MLKIRNDVDLKELEKYGFKKEPEKNYYYKNCVDYELFVWITKGYDYKPKYIYIEPKEYSMIISNFNIFYDLIKADLVEKVGERNESRMH